jgi:hypothetical protein
MADLLELVRKATPRMTVATLRRPRRRQLKPLGSPGVRFELFDGGVEFGESDIGVVKKPGGGGALEVGALPTAVRE